MGIKDGMWGDEPWALCATSESQSAASKTNDGLYAGYLNRIIKN